MNLIDPTSLYFSAAAEAAAKARKKETEAKKTAKKQNFSALLKSTFDSNEEALKTANVS